MKQEAPIWHREISRRAILRGAAFVGTGLAIAALVGCAPERSSHEHAIKTKYPVDPENRSEFLRKEFADSPVIEIVRRPRDFPRPAPIPFWTVNTAQITSGSGNRSLLQILLPEPLVKNPQTKLEAAIIDSQGEELILRSIGKAPARYVISGELLMPDDRDKTVITVSIYNPNSSLVKQPVTDIYLYVQEVNNKENSSLVPNSRRVFHVNSRP